MHYARLRVPFASRRHITFRGGNILSQEIKSNGNSFWFHDLFLEQPLSLRLNPKSDQHLILFILKKECGQKQDKHQFKIEENDCHLCYLPKNSRTKLHLKKGNYAFFQLNISQAQIQNLAEGNETLLVMLQHAEAAPHQCQLYYSGYQDFKMQNSIHEIKQALPENAGQRTFFLKIKANELLQQLACHFKKYEKEEQHNENMLAIAQYITAHLDKQLTIAQLAQQFHISNRNICRQFKQFHGLTIHKFILTKKMDLAAFLLNKKVHNLSEIAYLTGFEDTSGFRRAFKRFFQMTPTDFLKK